MQFILNASGVRGLILQAIDLKQPQHKSNLKERSQNFLKPTVFCFFFLKLWVPKIVVH